MGVLNSLEILAQNQENEWVRMAQKNARRLEHSLETLLDLAALEGSLFHARLREVDLQRWWQGFQFSNQFPNYRVEFKKKNTVFLIDPQKLGKAVDLILRLISARSSKAEIQLSPEEFVFEFELTSEQEKKWTLIWSQSTAGIQSGITSPFSAFSGLVQSEESFLSRGEEGLGSELLLIHEIALLHDGKFRSEKKALPQKKFRITLTLEFPKLSREEGILAVLKSRMKKSFESIALILIHGDSAENFQSQIEKLLFRADDVVYGWGKNQLAILMDGYREGAPSRVIERIQKEWSSFSYGVAQYPQDGFEPETLLAVAEKRMNG